MINTDRIKELNFIKAKTRFFSKSKNHIHIPRRLTFLNAKIK